MVNIKETALRIGEEADEYADAKLQSKGEFHPDWHTVRDEYFAEAIIAELAKQNEPVCEWVKSDNGNYLVQKWAKDYVAMQGDKFYTVPPTAEQIANETAEAIAKFVAFQRNDIPATGIEFAEVIRNGAWKDFKK